MAHETLKNLITNNIKTNGQNAITAQILQDVLIAMVDDYPDLSGYATRNWVQQQDYAPKEWVWESLAGDTNEQIAISHLTTALSAYATITQLGNYLRLTGGTITGNLNISSNGNGYAQMFVDEDGFNIMVGALTNRQIYTGKIYSDSTITSIGFIKDGGTSAQFLKADGSVDSNTYITASALSDYLPLTGGTLTGNLVFSYDKGIYFGTDNEVRIMRGGDRLLIINERSYDIVIGDWENNNYTSIVNDLQGGSTDNTYNSVTQKWLIQNDGTAQFKTVTSDSFTKNNGTSDEVLCADGSTKTLTELRAALNAI